MAEDTRKIVYYKGKQYRVEYENSTLTKLQSENGTVELLVETKNVLTPEQFEEKKKNRRSEHVNWIK